MENIPFSIASYQTLLDQKRLAGSRCLNCGETYLPPRSICHRCQKDQMIWVDMPTKGRLAAFTAIHMGTSKMVGRGYGRDRPYCVGVVELENGVKVSVMLLGVDPREPQSIQIGAPVEVEFIEEEEGVVLGARVQMYRNL